MKNTKLFKLLAVVIAVIMVVGVMAACSKATDADKGVTEAVADAANNADNGDSDDTIYRTLDQIKKSGSIKIGVFSDKNRFGFVDENGEYHGYDVYFARRIAKDLGVEVEFVSTEAANRVEALQTGKVDIILANFTVTEERAQQVDFALPYMNVALGVVSPSDKAITDLTKIEYRQESCRLTRCGAHCSHAAFKLRDLILNRHNGRICKSRIDKRFCRIVKNRCYLLSRIVNVGSALNDRHYSRLGIFRLIARLNAFCFYFIIFTVSHFIKLLISCFSWV